MCGRLLPLAGAFCGSMTSASAVVTGVVSCVSHLIVRSLGLPLGVHLSCAFLPWFYLVHPHCALGVVRVCGVPSLVGSTASVWGLEGIGCFHHARRIDGLCVAVGCSRAASFQYPETPPLHLGSCSGTVSHTNLRSWPISGPCILNPWPDFTSLDVSGFRPKEFASKLLRPRY